MESTTKNQRNLPISKPVENKETVTVAMVMFFLLFLLAFFIGMMLYLRYSEISPLYKFYHKPDAVPVNLSTQVSTQLTQVKTGKTVELKITAADMGNAVGISNELFPLKNAVLSIDQEGVKVSGKTKSWFGLNVEITLIPTLEKNQLKFSIKEIKSMGVIAPKKVADLLNTQISQSFQNLLIINKNVKITDFRLMVGYIYIEGTNNG